MSYVYVWKYRVKSGSREAFEKAYGPEGDWVRLFRRADGYLRTELLQSQSDPLEYMTVDNWESKAANDAFSTRFAHAFEQLDKACEELTESETFVGDFYRK